MPFFENETADLIYCSHSFEYFDQIYGEEVLLEWNRVLKPGGLLRLAVPDFEALVKVYKDSSDLNKIIGPLYGRMKIKTKSGDKTLFHKTTYDEKLLTHVLQKTGFTNIRRYDWQDTIHKDFDDHSQAYIPHMDKENGLLISFFKC